MVNRGKSSRGRLDQMATHTLCLLCDEGVTEKLGHRQTVLVLSLSIKKGDQP